MAEKNTTHIERSEEVEQEVKVHSKTWIVVFCINTLYFCQLLAVVGSGLTTQSMERLFSSTGKGVWLSQVIVISTASLSPPVTQIVDYWGRKWTLVILGTFGFMGAIIISRANSMGMLIAGFTVISINFGSQPILMAVPSEILPRKHRPWAQALMNTGSSIAGMTGIIMAGFLLRYNNLENYRIYWYVAAALYAIATTGCAILYNPPPRELQLSMTLREKIHAVDWVGFFTSAPGLVLFCIALSWSQNPYRWNDAHILAPFILGLSALFLFSLYEWRFHKDGILHHDLFQNRNFPLALAAISSEGFTFFTLNNYLAFEVGLLYRYDLLISGLHFGVLFLVATPAGMIIGWCSTRWKTVRFPITLGFISFTVCYICLAVVTSSTPRGVFWAYPGLAGIAAGACIPSIIVTAQMSTPSALIARSTGLIVSFRSVGATIGLAANNAIFNGALSTEIPNKIRAATLQLGLPPSSLGPLIGALTSQNQAALTNIPGATPEIIDAAEAALKEAYLIGFRYLWITAAVLSFVVLLSSLFIKVPRSEFNHHIDAPVEDQLVEAQKLVEGRRLEESPKPY